MYTLNPGSERHDNSYFFQDKDENGLKLRTA